MEPKFKLGDRVRYIGKKRYGKPIPNTEYHIVSEAMYCPPPMGADFVVGDYEYDIAPAPENDDPNDHYTYIKEEYLVLVNPSKIIFG